MTCPEMALRRPATRATLSSTKLSSAWARSRRRGLARLVGLNQDSTCRGDPGRPDAHRPTPAPKSSMATQLEFGMAAGAGRHYPNAARSCQQCCRGLRGGKGWRVHRCWRADRGHVTLVDAGSGGLAPGLAEGISTMLTPSIRTR